MARVLKLKNNDYLYGVLIDKGSNQNGEWEKYSDGRLIQRGRYMIGDIAFNTARGNLYGGANNENIAVIQYPINFIDKYNHVKVSVEGNSYLTISCNNTNGYKNQFTSYVLSPTNGTVRNVCIMWEAKGYWK